MNKPSTIKVSNSDGMSVGDTFYLTEPLVLKWWVKLWNFIIFKKVDKFIECEYVIDAVVGDGSVDILPLVVDDN